MSGFPTRRSGQLPGASPPKVPNGSGSEFDARQAGFHFRFRSKERFHFCSCSKERFLFCFRSKERFHFGIRSKERFHFWLPYSEERLHFGLRCKERPRLETPTLGNVHV